MEAAVEHRGKGGASSIISGYGSQELAVGGSMAAASLTRKSECF